MEMFLAPAHSRSDQSLRDLIVTHHAVSMMGDKTVKCLLLRCVSKEQHI